VPAVFTIFPEMTRWSLGARILVAIVWIAVVAGTLVIGAERVPESVGSWPPPLDNVSSFDGRQLTTFSPR